MTEEEKINKLEAFVYDNDIQKQLREVIANSVKPYNIFEIVGMGEQEIKHSNFLAWLFELQIEGYGYLFLEDFLRGCLHSYENKENGESLLKLKEYIYLSQKTTVKVYREYRNIDLIIEDKENGVVIVIENKVNAGESEYQLKKYQSIVEEQWKNEELWKKFYFFLSPNGTLASEKNRDTWRAIDYSVIAKPLEKLLETIKQGKISLNGDFVLLLEKSGKE